MSTVHLVAAIRDPGIVASRRDAGKVQFGGEPYGHFNSTTSAGELVSDGNRAFAR
jgi:hypothetical protein